MTTKLPTELKSDFVGYVYFVELFNRLNQIRRGEIILDFLDTIWFDANLSAVLGALLSRANERFNIVKFQNINSNIELVLQKNGFLSYFGGEIVPDINHTTIQFRKFEVDEEVQFKQYLDNELLSQPELPQMSELLKKKINKSIFEIFNNAKIHGNCKHVFSCGQFFPQLGRLDFTIVDLGNTIRKNVREFLKNKEMSGEEALYWAVQEGNTTKTGRIPGGLGLSLIRDFLKLNKGEIQIISSNGFYRESHGKPFASHFEEAFIGTIVNLEFNINDKQSYKLSYEINPDNIF